MRISGGTTAGNWEIGNDTIDTAPINTIRMAMTMATIGRLMKKRYISGCSTEVGLMVDWSATALPTLPRSPHDTAAGRSLFPLWPSESPPPPPGHWDANHSQ